MSRRIYTEQEIEYAKSMFENCQQALNDNVSEDAFKKTICYAHISGVFETVRSMGLIYAFSSTLVPCWQSEKRKEKNAIPENFCFPKDISPLGYAKRYVDILLKINKGRKEMYYELPGEMLFKISDCQQAQ